MAGQHKSLAVRLSTIVDMLRPRRRKAGGTDQATQGREPKIADASDLNISSAIQASSSMSVCAQNSKGLLELPLELVQDILKQLALQNAQFCRKDRISIQDLLELRRVNKLFDREIMKQLGRHFEHRSTALSECVWRAPVPFTVKLLQEFIGESIRRDSGVFARRMHASIDTLLEQSKAIGKPKERPEVLDHLCHALAKRRHLRGYFIPRQETETLLSTVAFVVAIAAQYTDIAVAMLQAGTIKVNEQTQDFGYLIDMAIVLGSVESARMLIQNGAALDNRSWSHTCHALAQAAGEGHLDMVDLIFQFMPLDQDHETFYTYGKVACRAAECQQWEIVRHLLDIYIEDIQIEEGKNLLCLAAKYGQDDIIRELLEPDIWNYDCTYVEYKSFPLREAAAGGHLSTCLLLIEKGLIKHVGPHRGEVMARFIAKGGNVELYHQLKKLKLGLWKEWQEIHFLPIAAQAGHLEFVKFAVESGCDRRPKLSHRKPPAVLAWEGEIQYPEDMRYFALLCAVVSGHLNVVRWLVKEIGVDVNNKAGLGGDSELVPATLAVFAGQVEMVKLLRRELGANPVPEDVAMKLWDVQYHQELVGKLNLYQRALRLRDDYKYWHPFGSRATTAFKVGIAEE